MTSLSKQKTSLRKKWLKKYCQESLSAEHKNLMEFDLVRFSMQMMSVKICRRRHSSLKGSNKKSESVGVLLKKEKRSRLL